MAPKERSWLRFTERLEICLGLVSIGGGIDPDDDGDADGDGDPGEANDNVETGDMLGLGLNRWSSLS